MYIYVNILRYILSVEHPSLGSSRLEAPLLKYCPINKKGSALPCTSTGCEHIPWDRDEDQVIHEASSSRTERLTHSCFGHHISN